MDALRLGTALVALIAARSASANPIGQWRPVIAEAAQRFNIPDRWIDSVMQAESAGLTKTAGRPIRSRVGAIGLMQLMPATWQDMRQAYHLGTDPDQPRDNILAGAAYLRALYDRFGFPGLFAAYNAGPARYAASLASGQRLPRETSSYLDIVTGQLDPRAVTYKHPQRHTLFVVRYDGPDLDSSPLLRVPDALLVTLRSVTP